MTTGCISLPPRRWRKARVIESSASRVNRRNEVSILFPWLVSLVWHLNPSFPANTALAQLVPLLATLAWLSLSRGRCCGDSARQDSGHPRL